MTLPNFLTKKLFKNYLRVFADIGRQEYSIDKKKDIIDKFIEISKCIFSEDNLKYDVDGKKIGLAKGSPLLGEKALNKRLEKYGHHDINSISTTIPGSKCQSLLHFLPLIDSRPAYCEITFTWDYNTTNKKDTAISLFIKLNDIVEVEYGYAYLAFFNTSIAGEWKTNIFGTSYRPNSEQIWDKEIGLIKDGAIKKIYTINCFNRSQRHRSELKFDKTSVIDNGRLEICILKS